MGIEKIIDIGGGSAAFRQDRRYCIGVADDEDVLTAGQHSNSEEFS